MLLWYKSAKADLSCTEHSNCVIGRTKLAQEVLYYLYCSNSYICNSSFRSDSSVHALYCTAQCRKSQKSPKPKEWAFEYLDIYIQPYCLWMSFLSDTLCYKKWSSGTCETSSFSVRTPVFYHSEQGFMERACWGRTPKPKQVRFILAYTEGKWQHLSCY